MDFEDRFKLADEYLDHVDTMMASIDDEFIKTRYFGFVAVSAVTAYELAIKDIIYTFCDLKHRALGQLARSRFEKLNGQIKIADIRDRHVSCFGSKYKKRFIKELEMAEAEALEGRTGSIKSSYGNLIVWRHNFVHEGEWPSTATYTDIRRSYMHGKSLIRCIDRAMVR